jgi:ubiquinone/menaquinone biosynthesis C-methylase UbiE
MSNSSTGLYPFGVVQKEFNQLKMQSQAADGFTFDKKAWDHVELTPTMKVLVLTSSAGIIAGTISCKLAKIVHLGEVIGVDTDESFLEEAKHCQQTENVSNVTFQQGHVDELDLPEASVDFVYARFLFQHLSDPMKAVANIYRVLKPGGKVCLADRDDDWFTFYPEPPSYASLNQRIIVARQTKKVYRYVGRKLDNYLHQGGLTEVQTMIDTFTSNRLGLKLFLDLFWQRCRVLPPDKEDIVAKARDDLYSLLNIPYAWAGMGIFAVTGRKS